MMKKINIGGIVLILLGALFLAKSLGFLHDNLINYLWPLILIIIGIFIFNVHNWKMNIGGSVLILLGVIFMLDTAGIVTVSNLLANWWPVILIIIGFYILVKK